MSDPVSIRGFLGKTLAEKYLGPEPVAIEDWGHEDCDICEQARGRGGSNPNLLSPTERRAFAASD